MFQGFGRVVCLSVGRWEGALPWPAPRADGALSCELAGTACLLPSQLQAGIPAGEGGEAALPRGELTWQLVEGSCAVGCAGEGGALRE